MNNTRLTLYWGFGGVIALLLTLMIFIMYQIHQATNRIENVVLENITKTRLITEMRTAARERTVSLQKMLIINDSIETIDEWERFTYAGEAFIKARNAFIAMPLSNAEQQVLNQQSQLVAVNSQLQTDVINLILTNQTQQARTLLLETTIPAQDKIFSFMTEMIRLQEESSASALAQAHSSYHWTILIMSILAIASIVIAFVIMRFIINTISRSEQQLHFEKERAQITLQSIGDAVITTDAAGRIQQANTSAALLAGLTSRQLLGQLCDETLQIALEHAPTERFSPVSDTLQSQRMKHSQGDAVLLQPDGNSIAVEYTCAPIQDINNQIIGAVLTLHDVSTQRARSHELAQQARQDPLTGLLNRRELELILQEILTSIQRYTDEIAWLCFLDLDKFKPINDTYGHLAGDHVLMQVAEVLRQHTRKTDYLARLGGDEFCVILRNCEQEMALAIMERIRRNLSERAFRWEHHDFNIGVSIGITRITSTDPDITSLIHKADSACYTAKNEGRNRVVFYSSPSDKKSQT